MNTITTQELKARLDEGADLTLVDTRSPGSFERGHLPGALSGMSDHILEQAQTLLPDRDRTVVLYTHDSACRRALRATERLETLGYSDLLVYEGGLQEWRDEGLPVEDGAAVQG